MFEVHYTDKPNCYCLVSKSTGDEFLIEDVQKSVTYPMSAKRPYKSDSVYLKKNCKRIKLNMSKPSSKQLYSVMMDRLSLFIIRQEDRALLKRQEEEEKYSLLSQNLDDISY